MTQYFHLLKRLNYTLKYHIENAPMERNYKANFYLDMEEYLISEERVKKVREYVGMIREQRRAKMVNGNSNGNNGNNNGNSGNSVKKEEAMHD